MSRHVIEEGNIKWVFGWDQPLLTFYLQKHDLSLPEEDRIVVWLPEDTVNKPFYEVDDLVRAAHKQGLRISHSQQVKLYGEKDDGI